MDYIGIQNIDVNAILGIRAKERNIKQHLSINVEIYYDTHQTLDDDNIKLCIDYTTVTKDVKKYVEKFSFKTLESLANNLARHIILKYNIPKIKVILKKPEALTLADYPFIEITRTLDDYKTHDMINDYFDNKFYLALGSNLGNKYQNILVGLQLLKDNGIKILKTSFMYKTEPMYDEAQPYFYNMVCQCSNPDLTPQDLLKITKGIEQQMGRIKEKVNGSRNIDIDILFFNQENIKTDTLVIPHPRILERGFVVIPLLDMIPNMIHPVVKIKLGDVAKSLGQGLGEVERIIPFKNEKYLYSKRPFIMSIINATPDSFSQDGLLNKKNSIDIGKQTLAHIIDIGGESTRPEHIKIDSSDEIKRLEIVLDLLRINKLDDKLISIDTRKADVAEHMINKYNVDIINDVTGFDYDEKMIDVILKYQIPVVVTHWTNKEKNNEDVVDTLGKKVKNLEEMGLYKWNIILDPGIGLGKNLESNLNIWKNLDILVSYNFPVLLGQSRKKHISNIATNNMKSVILNNEDLDIISALLTTRAIEHGVVGFRTHNTKLTKYGIHVGQMTIE